MCPLGQFTYLGGIQAHVCIEIFFQGQIRAGPLAAGALHASGADVAMVSWWMPLATEKIVENDSSVIIGHQWQWSH